MGKTITWLHFSDVHLCNPKSGWEANNILEKLRDDLHRLQDRHGLAPDLIFFTGDAAFGHLGEDDGKSITEQFREAGGLFKEICGVFEDTVPIENFFIVPGNHDVKRTKLLELINNGFKLSLEGKDYAGVEKALNELIKQGGDEWEGFINRLSDYRQFLADNDYTHLLQDSKRLIYAVEREINGVKIGIAGLNSAWSCYQDGEKGKLWLAGHWQIQTLSRKLSSVELRIALMHHPFNWFCKEEDPSIQREMENHFDFFLHGHEHQDWVNAQADGFTRIGAGASYGDSESETGYNVVRLYLDNGRGDVWLRRYDRKGEGWIPQSIHGKTNNDGVWQIQLGPQAKPSPGKEPDSVGDVKDVPSASDENMWNPNTAESIEFVNRTNELQFMNIYCPPYLVISAPAGYGKTRLIENVKNQLKQKNWLCIYLKLSREKKYSIQKLTDNILQQVREKQIKNLGTTTPEMAGNAISKCILKGLKNKPRNVLLLVDEAEALEEKVAKQLLNQCIPAIKDGLTIADTSIHLRLVCAGRYLSHWTQWVTRLPLELMALTSFDFPAVYETVEKFASTSDIKIAPEYRKDFAAHLMYFTGGHPGCMVDILRKDYGSPGGLIVSNENEYYKTIVKPVIEEIREHIPPDLQKVFETLSVIRYFNPRLLRSFIDKKFIMWDKSEYELENLLRQTYLVNPEGGFLKDNIVRRLLAIRLRKTNSAHFTRVCKEAISFYTSRLQELRSYRPDIVAVELLFQKLQYLVYKQHGSKEQFFEILDEILKTFVSERDPWEVMEGFMQVLGKDWEFRFTLNYLLKQDIYNDAYPFNELMNKIQNFRKGLKGEENYA